MESKKVFLYSGDSNNDKVKTNKKEKNNKIKMGKEKYLIYNL